MIKSVFLCTLKALFLGRVMRRNEFSEALRRLEIAGDPLTDFVPNPGGQMQFCDALRRGKKELILSGANDSGKSYLGVVCDAWWIVPERDKYGTKTGFTVNPHHRMRIPPEGISGIISTWSDKVQQNTLQPLIDKILKKYIVKSKIEGGSYIYLETEGGRIDFMWQQMGTEAYRGPKKHFIHLDEPHRRGIYRECQARLSKYGGVMWNTLTPVTDPDAMSTIRDLIWMKDSIIIPYEKDPSSRPLVEVIYMELDENPFHDSNEIRQRNMGMSREEIQAREHGRFIIYVEGAAFNLDIIESLKSYLINHPEYSYPQYGRLDCDPNETNIDNKITFREEKETFPDKPAFEDGWTIKIWQHPIKKQLEYRPTYYMSVDASTGKKGSDYTAVYVKRGDTHQIVASLHGFIDEVELAYQIWLLGHYYCDINYMPTMVVIETVSIGRATLQTLNTGLSTQSLSFSAYPYNQIYREPAIADLKMGIHAPSDSQGYFTGPGKRDFLVQEIRLFISEAYRQLQDGVVLIPDMGFLEEAENFITDKTGKQTAAHGANDDRLMASGLCEMAIKQGNFVIPVFPDMTYRKPDKSIWNVDNKEGVIRINWDNLRAKPEKAVNLWG